MSTGQKLKSKSESETFESTLSEVLPILGSEISLKFPETKLTSEELDHLSSVMLRAKVRVVCFFLCKLCLLVINFQVWDSISLVLRHQLTH